SAGATLLAGAKRQSHLGQRGVESAVYRYAQFADRPSPAGARGSTRVITSPSAAQAARPATSRKEGIATGPFPVSASSLSSAFRGERLRQDEGWIAEHHHPLDEVLEWVTADC